ncbi:unnamed protein product, partial [marine sediment metagenome]
MADSTLDSERLVLIDNWDGPLRATTPPTGGFLGATHHNIALASTNPYKLGEKITVSNDGAVAGLTGWSTFIYLCLNPTGAVNPTPAAKQFVVPVAASKPYYVTNDPDQCLLATGCPLAAVMLSIMSADADGDEYVGWFYCGGVVPEAHVSDLGGNFATEDNVAVGAVVAHDLGVGDAIGIGPCAGDTEAIIGFAY